MLQERVKSLLNGLGFVLEEMEDLGCSFEYEGVTLIYLYDRTDDQVSIVAPRLVQVTEENRVKVLNDMADLTSRMKYVQPTIAPDGFLWLFYQHYLGEDGQVTPDLLAHMINSLAVSTDTYHEIRREGEGEEV